MPSELDAHEILFSPLSKRRAERAARRAAAQQENSSGPLEPSRRTDREAPATDRAVAYAIAEAEATPLVSPRLIAGVAALAGVLTATVLMRAPELQERTVEEGAVEERKWWTAAREHWANEAMKLWPLVVRGNRSARSVSALDGTPSPSATPVPTAVPAPVTPKAAATASDNPYAGTPRTAPRAAAKASDNPYSGSHAAPVQRATSTDNPY